MRPFSARCRIVARVLHLTGCRFVIRIGERRALIHRVCGSAMLCNQAADRLALGLTL